MNRKDIETVQSKYPVGTQVRLISMSGEPQMKCGLIGEVFFVDDIGQIHVKWENGSTLALNIDVDEFDVL